MKYEEYQRLVSFFLKKDNREVNYQNRVLIPFLECLYKNSPKCIVDTSTLTREWNRRGIDRECFAEKYTPDLLIAENWRLKTGDTEKNCIYRALIEVKTPLADKRSRAEKMVKEYLTKVPVVILTNCLTWEFYYSTISDPVFISLEEVDEGASVTKVCCRKEVRNIRWKVEDAWLELTKRLNEI